MASGFVIQQDTLLPAIRELRRTLVDRVVRVLTPVASDMEQYAKANHPWQNQTGAAEAELNAGVEVVAAAVVEVFLQHGVFYGKYLEMRFGGRFAIVTPTLELYEPQLNAALGGVFR